MRHDPFAPLYRSTIGFDRLVQMLDTVSSADETTYPPYNIERLGENSYRITMAVAGFGTEDVNVELKEQALTVRGEKASDKNEAEYIHRGIAARAFERRFQLADYVEVVGADLTNGLLHIELARNLPERMRPRTVEIRSQTKEAQATIGDGTSQSAPQIEANHVND
ncbi:MAG: Hsp20 family protein [Pseudomonadota bacterium]